MSPAFVITGFVVAAFIASAVVNAAVNMALVAALVASVADVAAVAVCLTVVFIAVRINKRGAAQLGWTVTPAKVGVSLFNITTTRV